MDLDLQTVYILYNYNRYLDNVLGEDTILENIALYEIHYDELAKMFSPLYNEGIYGYGYSGYPEVDDKRKLHCYLKAISLRYKQTNKALKLLDKLLERYGIEKEDEELGRRLNSGFNMECIWILRYISTYVLETSLKYHYIPNARPILGGSNYMDTLGRRLFGNLANDDSLDD